MYSAMPCTVQGLRHVQCNAMYSDVGHVDQLINLMRHAARPCNQPRTLASLPSVWPAYHQCGQLVISVRELCARRLLLGRSAWRVRSFLHALNGCGNVCPCAEVVVSLRVAVATRLDWTVRVHAWDA